MALIPNASNLLTKGINEVYGVVTTGIKGGGLAAAAQKYKNDVAKGKATPGGMYYEPKNDTTTTPDPTPTPAPEAPPSLAAAAKLYSSGGSSTDKKVADQIGKGWDDTTGDFKAAGKSLDASKNYIDNLAKVRDQYLSSIDAYKAKEDAAIAGNKTLIEQNQKKDLDTLAGDTRKSIDNTNVMLGVKGASGGSASRAASRAIAESAGKSRAGLLTTYGDQTSTQNKAAENALEDYNTKRNQAYEDEKTMRQQAMDEYQAEKDALDRLSRSKSGWKEEDLKAASDRNLQKLLGGLASIQAWGQNFRNNLAAKMTEYGGLATALDSAAVAVDTPAELDTPKFSEQIDLTDPNNATDWFDPNNTGKAPKVIKDYTADGRPIYEDGTIGDVVDSSAPVTA